MTGLSTDTFTITRTQESTGARTVIIGDQIAAAITAQTITDIELADLNTFDMNVRGFLAWTFPPYVAAAGTVAVSQSLYVMKIWLPKTISVTNINVAVTTAGSSLTSTQNICTLYAQDGTKKGDTADQTAVWTTAGDYSMAVGGGPYSLTGGTGNYCWVSILSNGTTPASFAVGATRNAMNASGSGVLSGANLIAARNGTTITASPSPLVPGSNVITSSLSYWVGLS